MSSVNTLIAPNLSLIVIAYSLLSLYSFLGLSGFFGLNILTSYFTGLKLSAFCLGYYFDALFTQSISNIDLSYTFMTLLISTDSIIGFFYYLT